MRGRHRFLAAVGVFAALVAWALFGPSVTTVQAAGPPQRVIVIFKDQESNLPATPSQVGSRRRAVQAVQEPVTSQLSAQGASNVHSYTVLNAVSATVSSSEVTQLKANPAVSQVIPDQVIRLAPEEATGQSSGSGGGGVPGSTVCAPAGQAQLNPQALETIHADSDQSGAKTARSLGFTGAGVTAAFIADGLDINNPDFIRANGQHVFVDYKDFSGEGTGVPTGGEEAFGDASSIAAQGLHTYNVAGYGADAVTGTCNIRVEGVAPGASLVGLDVFGGEDAGFNSSILQAIDYAVTTDHVNVLNESFGGNPYPDDGASLDAIKEANDNAVAAGTTVTVSSGDAGTTNTIGSPASDPNVISAGATTTYRLDLQSGYGGAQFPGIKGYLDNDISSFSSSGFDQSGRTVDVVAPGELNWAVCSTDVAMYMECVNYAGQPSPVIAFGGTSESAPLTAGVAALVIQAYRKGHGGASPTPAAVKQIIVSTCDDIGAPGDQQGAGLIDAYQAVRAAESYSTSTIAPRPSGHTLLKTTGQLNAVAGAHTPQRLTDTITNNGSTTEGISLSTRALSPYTTVQRGIVTLSDAGSPKTTDWSGTAANYQAVTFNVPAGQNRLSASLAYQSTVAYADQTSLLARVRLTLVDPRGDLAAYSVPQGDGNYGNVQVTDPQAGTWTAYVWSRVSTEGGTQGPVLFEAQVAQDTTFGDVSPGFVRLAPGQSAPITLSVATPTTPGDSAGAIVLTSDSGPSFARQTTIPVTLRSVIATGSQTFTQTLTGGNGREAGTGQAFYYSLQVPNGAPELSASVALADNPNNPFTEFLVSPSGEALAQSANELPSATDPGYTNLMGAQAHVLTPDPGLWTLIVVFAPQVSGTALAEPFTVSTSDRSVPATSGGLPNATSAVLAAGKAQTYNVKVTNTGPEPEEYFIDARLPGSAPMTLVALTSPDTTAPLQITPTTTVPVYEIPTHTTAFTATSITSGPTPIQFDASAPAGDPDVISTAGTDVSASLTADAIAPGTWSVIPTVAGPFGATGAAQEPVSTTMNIATAPFDSTVSSSTGDLWQASVNPASVASFSPVVVGPGQSATIPVTITPSGRAGTQVSGTLYVDDTSLFTFQDNYGSDLSGGEVASFPYSYTVGPSPAAATGTPSPSPSPTAAGTPSPTPPSGLPSPAATASASPSPSPKATPRS